MELTSYSLLNAFCLFDRFFQFANNDLEVLAIAARERRVLVSSDRQTIE
ncbi:MULTISPECIES: hypothetical protein [Spirulina sp. CCY15215]|nr:hypothetical protein [Spirulina major]